MLVQRLGLIPLTSSVAKDMEYVRVSLLPVPCLAVLRSRRQLLICRCLVLMAHPVGEQVAIYKAQEIFLLLALVWCSQWRFMKPLRDEILKCAGLMITQRK